MDKKNKIINFIKGLIVIATAVTIVIGLSKILVLKSEDGINQFDALYKQPENSIDVLFSGSSKVYCDISTGALWDQYGIASFDLGGAEAPAWVSYYQIKEALRTQRPKVICYEVSVAAMFNFEYQKNSWASDNSYGMKWNSNRIDQLKVNSTDSDFKLRLNPFNIIHGRYKDLNENDFTNVRNTVNYKGFDPRENVMELERPVLCDESECTPCAEKDEEYIRKICALGREEGIPVLLFASPDSLDDAEERINNYIGMIAEDEGVEFIDFNRRYDELGLDFATDMADTDHLNYSGNLKYATLLGKMLKERFDLPDRRGDERYVSWEWDAALQRAERTDLEIQNAKSITDVMNLTGSHHLVFAIMDDKAVIFENNRQVDSQQISESGDPKFRMVYRNGDDTFLFTEGTYKYGRTCILYINDTEYWETLDNIAFVYDTMRHEFVRYLFF